MADSYNITVAQGDSYNLRLTATDSNGVAYNLSGYALRGHLKYKYSDTGVWLDLNPYFVSTTGGIIEISISGYQTESLPVFQGVYDVEAYNSGGAVIKLVKGYFNVNPEVTN